jgi:transposase-like protein
VAGRSTYSDEDKGAVLAVLAANGGNIKRTSRETGVAEGTLRYWIKKAPPSDETVQAAVLEFVSRAEAIRKMALDELEKSIETGKVSARELITVVGVLDDKITRAKGLPTQRTEQKLALPSREELASLLGGFVQGAIQMAEQRDEEIVDAEYAEVPEPRALPSPRE